MRHSLWFGLVAAAVAWALHELLSVAITSLACLDGEYEWTRLSPGNFRLLLAAVTVGLLGVAAAAGIISFRNWKYLTAKDAHDRSPQRELLRTEGWGREEFIALSGLFISVVSVIGIIWAGIPLILIDICGSAR